MPYKLLEEAPSEESLLGTAGRNILRTGARVAETAVGLPGDINAVLENVSDWLGEKTGLNKILPQEQSILPSGHALPTSEDVRKGLKSVTGDYLEPKKEWERKLDDFTQDLTSLSIPIPGLGAMKLGKAAMVSGLGNAAGWLAKDIGAGEGTQKGVKIGTMLLSSIIGKSGLKDKMSNLYKEAESLLPENVTVSAKEIETPIAKIEKSLNKGISTKSKEFLTSKIEGIKSKIKDGNIPVSEAWEIKRNLNELISEAGEEAKGLKKYLPTLSNGINNTLNEYGKTNPKFLKAMREADDLWKGFNVTWGVTDFLRKTVNPKTTGIAAASILYQPHHAGLVAKGIAGGWATRKTVEALNALAKSKEIRKHYLKTIGSAIAKNSKATVRNANNLDKVLNKEIGKDKSSFSGKGYTLID